MSRKIFELLGLPFQHFYLKFIFALCLLLPNLNIGAYAQYAGVFDVSYDVEIKSFRLGQVDVKGELNGNDYNVFTDAKLTGLVGAAFKINGGAEVNGRFLDTHSNLADAGYHFFFTTPKESDKISLSTRGGRVSDVSANPLPDPLGTRIPLQNRHKNKISDPITAFLLPAKNNTGDVSKIDCNHKVEIFDGRERFTISMKFKRMATAGETRFYKGYRGDIAICEARYKPIAGHRSDDELAAFSAKSKDMEIWLAPIVGTRRLFPYKFRLPTPFGIAEISASKFISMAQPIKHSQLQ